MITLSRAPLAPALAVLVALAAWLAPRLVGQDPAADPAREEYLKINYLFNRELFELAIPEYEKLLERYPDFAAAADVHHALALCHYQLYRKKEEKGETLATHRGLAEALRRAVEHLEKATAAKSLSSPGDAIRLLGQIHLLLGDNQRAADAFQRLLKGAGGENANAALSGLADARFLAGEFAAAAELYRELIARADPEASTEVQRARYYLAMALHRSGDEKAVAESGELFETIARDEKSEFRDDALYMAALSRETRGDFSGAEARYEQALEGAATGGPFAALARLGLARARFASSRYEEAAGALEDFLAKHARHERAEEASLLLARSLIELHRYSDAGKILQDLRRSPRVGDETALHLAAVLARHDRHDAAAQTLRVALRRFPDSPRREELQIELVRSLIAAGAAGEAEEILRAVVAQSTTSPRLDELAYLQAYVLLQREKLAESISVCNAFFERFPESPRHSDVVQIYAEAQFLSGDHAEASRAYSDFLAASASAAGAVPEAPQERAAAERRARFRVAQCHYLAGEYEDALRLLEALDDVPAGDDFFASRGYLIGEAAYQLEQFDRAATELGDFIAAHGSSGKLADRVQDARFKRAHALQLAGRAEEAESAYRQTLAARGAASHTEQALFELGQIAYERKDAAAAADTFTRLLDEYPQSRFAPFALRFLGWSSLEAGDREAALAYYGRLAESHADHELAADAQYQKALLLRETGRLEAARLELARFRERYPESELVLEARLQEGAALARTGDHDEALRVLETLRDDAKAAPLKPRVLYEIAWCHRSQGELDRAAATYAALVELDDRTVDASAEEVLATARLELAELEFERERYERALELLAPLVDAEGELGEKASYRACWCHHRLGDAAATIAAFERFAARWTSSALYSELAFLGAKALFDRGDAKRSAALFREVLEEHPESREAPLARLGLGECLLEQHAFAEAKRELAGFLSGNAESPFAPRARFGIGWADENLGSYEDAVKAYRDVVAAVSTPIAARAQFQIGQCLVAQKKYREAVVELLQVTAKYTYPEWCAKALLQVAGCFEAIDDRENARRYYQEVTSTYGERDEAKLARERLDRLETN